MNFEKINYQLTYAGLIVLALGVFTSVTFSSLAHILLLVPGLYFFTKWLKQRDFEIRKSVVALAGVIFVCWLSVIANWNIINNPWHNIFKTKYFIIAFLSYFSFHYTKKNFLSFEREKKILYLFLIATSIATLSGLIGLYSGFNPLKFKNACHESRSCGLYGMYMTYGYGISLFMVLMTSLVIYRNRLEKYIGPKWLYLAWIINFIGLVTSYARGAWIGFAGAIPFFFFKKNIKLFFIVISLSFLSLVSAMIFSDKVSSMFLERGTSNGQRILYWKTALIAVKEKPLLGYGYKNFEPNMKKIKKKYFIERWYEGGHAHNNFIEHLASTGIIGLMAYFLFVFYWLLETYRKQALIFPFVVSFVISGMTQYTFGDGENLFLILSIFSLF